MALASPNGSATTGRPALQNLTHTIRTISISQPTDGVMMVEVAQGRGPVLGAGPPRPECLIESTRTSGMPPSGSATFCRPNVSRT
jgi:hypothetical protein